MKHKQPIKWLHVCIKQTSLYHTGLAEITRRVWKRLHGHILPAPCTNTNVSLTLRGLQWPIPLYSTSYVQVKRKASCMPVWFTMNPLICLTVVNTETLRRTWQMFYLSLQADMAMSQRWSCSSREPKDGTKGADRLHK